MKKLLVGLVLLVPCGVFASGRHGHDNDKTTVIVVNPGSQGPQGIQGVQGVKGNTGDAGREKTEYIGQVSIRILDEKRYGVSVYDGYDFRARHNDEIGLRLDLKLGKSYEEKQIEELKRTIEELKSVAHRPGVHQENFYPEKPKYLYKK